jgi:hypothetical protein
LPGIGPLSGFAKAWNCCPDNVGGQITWADYLKRTYR